MTTFVDTSAIYALLDRSDAGHARAVRGRDATLGDDWVTHSYVVIETISIVRRRLGATATAQLVDTFLPALRIIDVDQQLRARAIVSFRAAVASDVSLVDRTSFQLMRDMNIARAWALDTDFETAGFVLVS